MPQVREPNTSDLLALLQQALDLLTTLEPRQDGAYHKLEALKERLLQERFHLAVLGQFKRGKSTLLNALLGAELLPTAVLPLTAIPTFLLWGPETRARVFYHKGHSEEVYFPNIEDLTSFLSQLVTEAGNPHNHKEISRVEVYYPCPLLQEGVVLIDTPGIGSTFRHNTEVTLNFLPQCDAALFLVSADPPVTEVEVEFLKAVRAKVSHLFFVLNKIDYLSEEEITTLKHFIKSVLQEQVGIEEDPVIFCVSARQGLEAKKLNDPSLWALSGMQEVWSHLVDFLNQDKKKVLQEALAKKASDVIAEALMQLDLTVRSLQMPLAELEKRLSLFAEKLQEAERQRVLVGDLLAGDRKRLIAFLEAQAEYLRQKARAHFEGIVQDYVVKMGDKFSEQEIREILAEAIPSFFARELEEISRTVEARLTEILRPYHERAEELIETIRKAAAELFDIPYHPPLASDTLERKRQPYWVTHKWESGLAQLSESLLTKLLPLSQRRARIINHLMKQIEALVLHNVENLRWATLQNLEEAFRHFEAALYERLQTTISATHGAIQAAHAKRLQQKRDVGREITGLQSKIEQLQDIRAQLTAIFFVTRDRYELR